VALLLALAGLHFALVRCCSLHPWLGGGFGMFSTVDERQLRLFRVDAGGERPLEVPPELEDFAERVEALPIETWLRAFVGALAEDPELAGAALRAEVWETRFDASMRPVPRRLAGFEAAADRGER
jgi:hypothetical protein